MISYSQNNEDVMLWRALGHVQKGFYIDVGANDSVIDSVTKHFYDNGWSGINIEPIAFHHANLVKDRPRDINLCCAASAERGTLSLWECDVRGWSTASGEVIAKHIAENVGGRYQEVEAIPLHEICHEYANGDIHFLKIDVEGFEGSVIEGMDFKAFRPWILLIEATRPNSPLESDLDWEPKVLAHDYSYIYHDGLNRFYLAKEHLDLAQHFRYPPNVFDRYIRWDHMMAEQRASKSEQTAVSAERQIRAAELRAQLAEQRAAQAERQIRAAELRAQLAEQRAAQAERQVQTAELRAQHAESSAKAADLMSEFWLAELNAIHTSTSWWVTAPIRKIKSFLKNIQSKKALALHPSNLSELAPDTIRSTPIVEKRQGIPCVVLDIYVLAQGVKTGVYRVCDELFTRLSKRTDLDIRFLVRENFKKQSLAYLREKGLTNYVVYEDSSNKHAECDILLSPFGVAPSTWLNDSSIQHAHIIYDLIGIHHPEFFSAPAAHEVSQIMGSLTNKTLVFAISNYTKRDLLAFRTDLSASQVQVIPLAAGPQFSPTTDKKKIEGIKLKYGIPARGTYILSLATLEIRKNLNVVVDSFIEYHNRHPSSDLYLVLAGMSGWKLDALEKALNRASLLRGKIILTGYVEDGDLSALYTGATCFIYLSQYEGFGLPPLEAMACGTPVICSNNSSLPEVVGDAGVMIDSNDVSGAADSIELVISSDFERHSMSAKGLKQSKKFNWDLCESIVAERLIEFYLNKDLFSAPDLVKDQPHTKSAPH